MKPLTKQRSVWTERPDLSDRLTAVVGECAVFTCNVHDGALRAIVTEDPGGWHLSISHGLPNGEPGRYPTWDEIAHARYQLLPEHLDFVMHLPPPDQYVAVHDTTFHLHEHPERHA